MKTAEIKDLLKKEVLIIELQTDVINSSYHIQRTPKGILIKDDTGEKFISNKYTLLGKPDEIKEDDVRELVEKVMQAQHFQNYKARQENDFANLWCKTAKESLLSAIETVVHWENPLGDEPNHLDYKFEKYKGEFHFKSESHKSRYGNAYEKWQEAELSTFDRNRTLIFIEN